MMVRADYGSQALNRLHQLLGAETEWTAGEVGFRWSLWGARQRVWSESVRGEGNRPTWRLRLRTRALEGFTGSLRQRSALMSTVPPATLAALVRSLVRPDRLELAITLDLHEGNFGWALRTVAIAARVQAVTARILGESRTLDGAGLSPGVDPNAGLPVNLRKHPEDVLFVGPRPHTTAPCWPPSEFGALVGVLRGHAKARAVQTPSGILASLGHEEVEKARCILEVKSDTVRPTFGKGLSVVLTTAVRGGVLDAMLWNEREVGPQSRGDSLGGWWACESGLLVHNSFYPDVLHRKDLALHVVLASTRRAREANAAAIRLR